MIFTLAVIFFDLYASLISLVLYDTNKTLRAIVLLFCSNFFQSFECDGKSITFHCYWLIKGLIFDILWALFSMFWWFNATVNAYWKQLSSFLFSGFIVALLTILETLCMICLFSSSFYLDNNTINQHCKKETRFLFSLILLILLDVFAKKNQ